MTLFITLILNIGFQAQRAMAASVSLGRSVLSPSPQAPQASLMAPANPSYLSVPSTPRPRQASPDQIVPPITPVVSILDPALDMQTLKKMQDLEAQIQTLKHENEQQVRRIAIVARLARSNSVFAYSGFIESTDHSIQREVVKTKGKCKA